MFILHTNWICVVPRVQNMKIIDGKPEYKGAIVSTWSHFLVCFIYVNNI